jgi:hypothetical protein
MGSTIDTKKINVTLRQNRYNKHFSGVIFCLFQMPRMSKNKLENRSVINFFLLKKLNLSQRILINSVCVISLEEKFQSRRR